LQKGANNRTNWVEGYVLYTPGWGSISFSRFYQKFKTFSHSFKTLISKTYAILQIKIIKYKKEILILTFLFAIVIVIFCYRDLITEVVIKLLQVFSKLLDKLKNEQPSTGPNTTKTENSKNNNNVYKETEEPVIYATEVDMINSKNKLFVIEQ
jgi:hypothetical protein